ncbi:MAG: hypothetical protein ACP5O7_12510 [Phycisphaerae bacterium]
MSSKERVRLDAMHRVERNEVTVIVGIELGLNGTPFGVKDRMLDNATVRSANYAVGIFKTRLAWRRLEPFDTHAIL